MTDLFDPPIRLTVNSKPLDVTSVEHATLLLASVDWPGDRGPEHRDAYETCLKVADGHRSTAAGLLAGA